MNHNYFRTLVSSHVLLILVTWIGVIHTPAAQTLVETSAEARFQLDIQVPQSALSRYIPKDWEMDVRTEGAAKDANLRVVFIERLSINGADGKPVGDGSNLLVYLIAPVKDKEGKAAQLVIGGITQDPADAPGPFGVYLPASIHTLKRTTTSGSGPVIETQDWSFVAATGEQFKMSVTFDRGVGNTRPVRETRFYSASNPKFYQIYKEARMLEILRNVTTTPTDKVKMFSFTAGGGKYADLFDGKEKVLSWDNFMWQNSEVFLP